MGAHLLGAERAVEPDRERRGMAHRNPERLRRLSRQHAARQVGDGAGDHDRDRAAACLEQLGDGKERRLGVEGVEHRLEQQQVGAALEQALGLLAIGLAQFVEGDGAEAGIVDVGRDRGGAVGRTDGAGDEARPSVLARGDGGGLLGEARSGDVELGDQVLRAVIGLGDPCRRERIGGDDVGAGAEVVEMKRAHRIGLRQGSGYRCCRAGRSANRQSGSRDSRPRRARAPGSRCPWRRRAPGSPPRRGFAARSRPRTAWAISLRSHHPPIKSRTLCISP